MRCHLRHPPAIVRTNIKSWPSGNEYADRFASDTAHVERGNPAYSRREHRFVVRALCNDESEPEYPLLRVFLVRARRLVARVIAAQ